MQYAFQDSHYESDVLFLHRTRLLVAGVLCPGKYRFRLASDLATNLHTNEFQVNVYPNYPQVTLLVGGNSNKLSTNNSNLKENLGILAGNFLQTAMRPVVNLANVYDSLPIAMNITQKISSKIDGKKRLLSNNLTLNINLRANNA